jgi:uncharacterized protein
LRIQKGDWALVTGASSGIGRAFAQALASRGANLFSVALEAGELAKLSIDWQTRYKVQTIDLALDLADPNSFRTIEREVDSRKLEIAVLINAAGFGYFGSFTSMTHEQIAKMVQVDVISLVQLCRLFFPKMIMRKRGAVVNIASIAGCLSYPYAAVYSAGKSFVHLFTRALWAENPEKAVKLISLCPGYTKTNFEKVSTEPESIHLFRGEDPKDIADKTIRHFSHNSCTVFTKPFHPIKVLAAKMLPLKMFAWMLRYLSTAKNKSR